MKRYIHSDYDPAAFDSNPDIRRGVAERTDDPELLELFAYDPNMFVRRAAAKNKYANDYVISEVIENYEEQDTDDYTLWDLAGKSNAISGLLKRYHAAPSNWRVREALAHNCNCPVDLLVQFADDEYYDVRAEVGGHPNTPVDILAKLSQDPEPIVREFVAENPNTPLDILEKLVADEESWVSRNACTTIGKYHARSCEK